MGDFEVSLENHEFYGFSWVISEIYPVFLQGCYTPYSSEEEGRGFSLGA